MEENQADPTPQLFCHVWFAITIPNTVKSFLSETITESWILPTYPHLSYVDEMETMNTSTQIPPLLFWGDSPSLQKKTYPRRKKTFIFFISILTSKLCTAMANTTIHRRLLEPEQEQEPSSLRGRVLEESKKIWRVAMPSVISRVSSFGTIVVTQSFMGHISSLDLASYALVQTITVRFVNGILVTNLTNSSAFMFMAKTFHVFCFLIRNSDRNVERHRDSLRPSIRSKAV